MEGSPNLTMAALLEPPTPAATTGPDGLPCMPAGLEAAAWGVEPSKVRVVASTRAADVAIVAGSSEPPVTIAPSSLVRDLKGLLSFDDDTRGEEERGWPRLFQTVALRLEEGMQYTVGVHGSWLGRRCFYFCKALSSGTWISAWLYDSIRSSSYTHVRIHMQRAGSVRPSHIDAHTHACTRA